MNANPNKTTRATVYGALALLIVAAYWETPFHDFVNYDDPLYVTDSPITQAGITWEGIRWAFTDTSSGNWHPLTRIAHMVDCELFGLNPAGHHVINVAWHIVATLILLSVLTSMTGAFWPSAFVAALFGLHPLHVESVAWISERKDIMSAVCWFAAMGLHARYARNPSVVRYIPVAIMLAIGLMFKAMLVTLPCVLLLLDIWPLHRFGRDHGSLARCGARLVAEKLPLFILVAIHAVITVQTQRIAMTPTNTIPLIQRVANAMFAYSAYVGQVFWPAKLAVFYPYSPLDDSMLQAIVLGAILIVITMTTLVLVRRAPYLAVGWLWFLGTLVPVIGLVQVGLQSRADRYTYIPSVGLFIAAAWLGAAVLKTRPGLKKPITAGAIAAVVICAVLTTLQTRYWKDTFSLFQHALAVTDDNPVAENNVGSEYLRRGDPEQARRHFEQALEISERFDWKNIAARAHFGLGRIAEDEGDLKSAEKHYIDARVGDGAYSEAHNNLAGIYMVWGQHAFESGDRDKGLTFFDSALALTEQALEHDPDNYEAALNAAFLYQFLGDQRELPDYYRSAALLYQTAIDHAEPMPAVYYNYSLVLARLGQYGEAIRQVERAIELDPAYKDAQEARLRYLTQQPVNHSSPETETGSNDDA